VPHELAEGAFVVVGHVGELNAEAHVADVVEDFAVNLPPFVVGQRDAYVDGLAEERLDGVSREQAAALAQARDLAVVLIILRRPPLDRQRGRHTNDLSASSSFSHVKILARYGLRGG